MPSSFGGFVGKVGLALICMLLCGSLLLAADKGKQKPKPLTPEERFLRDAPARIANRFFGKADLKQCKTYLKKAKDNTKYQFALILARYMRAMEKEPVYPSRRRCRFTYSWYLWWRERVESKHRQG